MCALVDRAESELASSSRCSTGLWSPWPRGGAPLLFRPHLVCAGWAPWWSQGTRARCRWASEGRVGLKKACLKGLTVPFGDYVLVPQLSHIQDVFIPRDFKIHVSREWLQVRFFWCLQVVWHSSGIHLGSSLDPWQCPVHQTYYLLPCTSSSNQLIWSVC